jgi:hypothetical protein
MALIMMCAAFDAGSAIDPFEALPSVLGLPRPEFFVMLVAIAPGCTTVTFTCVSLSSAYNPSVKIFTAAFDAP